MAIKIDENSIVRVIRPERTCFNLVDLNTHVNGFIEPFKIGPVWVMYNEKAKEEGHELNMVASFFFNVAIYGTVLIVPPQQLPLDWDILDENDLRYSAEDVDSGFLLSLHRALMRHRLYGKPGLYTNVENLMDALNPQEEYTFLPPNSTKIDENTQDFYRQVYDYIITNPDKFQKNIVLSEPGLMIKVPDEEARLKMVSQMIDYFVSTEEYEKCAKIKSMV